MSPKLYYNKMSPPSRASLLTVKALGLDAELISVNLAEGEHLKPDYIKINPLHTVPALDDNGFLIWDSHAINAYLVGKYGKDDSLYPKRLEKRAVIDQRLHFDTGILSARLSAIVVSILRGGAKSVAKDKADFLVQGYQSLETLLEGKKFVAGDELSIADFNLMTTVSSCNVLVPLATNRFPNIANWMSAIQELPYYSEANQEGLDLFSHVLKSKMA